MEIDISQFLDALSPVLMYEQGKAAASYFAMYITPFLLVIAIGIRTLEIQVDAVASGSGKWGIFIKDIGVWATVLAVYFSLASLINDVFTLLYEHFAEKGSLGRLMELFNMVQSQMESSTAESGGILDGAVSFIGDVVGRIAYGVYYMSFVVVSFVASFLQSAHAMAYAFAIIWGLVAIPMSITTSFKLLSPWAKFTGIILIWPIIHYIIFALFMPIFTNAVNVLLGDSVSVFDIGMDKLQIYVLFTIINFIAISLITSAPFIAQSLITSGSISGIVAPFTAAGISAAASVLKIGNDARKTVSNGVKNSASKNKTENTNQESSNNNPVPSGDSKEGSMKEQGDISLPRQHSDNAIQGSTGNSRQEPNRTENRENSRDQTPRSESSTMYSGKKRLAQDAEF
ncbi:MAG: hypothetical protein ACE5EH_11810 [Gammaproteobacteria bacterium]